jgi:hypothetical protein
VKRGGVPEGEIAIMSRGITLAPCGLTIERVEANVDRLVITAKPIAKRACCPACGEPSERIHSHYRRSLSDLPLQGRQVTVVVSARRFRCSDEECPQQIFAERLEATSGVVFARRTGRLEGIVHHLALALGGRPGQNFAKRLLLPASNDTLLRTLRRHASQSTCPPMASASTISPGGEAIATARSLSTWSGGGSSTSLRIGRPALLLGGWRNGRRSVSSRAIAALAIDRLPRKAARTLCRSPTGGILWKTPAPLS